MLSGQRSASGLLAKPTTRQVMVYIRFFLYQGYDILFYREAHCKVLCSKACRTTKEYCCKREKDWHKELARHRGIIANGEVAENRESK
jgi:hypothetical protein